MEQRDDLAKRLSQTVEEFHYTEVHTALEQYRDEEYPGSITRIEYPSEDADHSNVRVFFTEATDE